MDINFRLFDLIVILGISQGLVYSALLLVKYGQYVSKRILALILFVFCILSAKILLHTLGLWQNPYLRYFPLAFDLTFQPLLYLYVVSLTQKGFTVKRSYFLHFAPTLIFFAHALWVYIQTQTTDSLALKDQLAEALHFNAVKEVEDILSVLSGAIYGFLSYRRVVRYRQWLFNTIASTSYPTYLWLRNVLIATGGIFGLLVINIFLDFSVSLSDRYFVHWQLFYVYLAATVYYLGIMGYQQVPFEVAFDASESEPSPKRVVDTLPYDQVQTIKHRIDVALEQDRLFLDPELNLNSLASRLHSSPGLVSAVINSEFDKSFRSLINERRVEEVKHRLTDPAYKHLSILGIALETGFNSEASFYRVFKSITGLSPRQYSAQIAPNTESENSQKLK
ncbi:helix-turn-helix domain-containing protein [Spirosoma foliorum]|uniref:AraC family transcriptional regulator n=1 Tax=Spirosoma foliorum TaxID=2710596 RepID=A0A7G5H6B8_9BACT|nr:helix-turn-helix domain-containing protein [Spirosoma foliorum]QMW06660.1 AraC family transcriptional regulator [Spirosoma foliorum]